MLLEASSALFASRPYHVKMLENGKYSKVVSPLFTEIVLLLLSKAPHGHAHQVVKVLVGVLVLVIRGSLHHCSVKVLVIWLGLNKSNVILIHLKL